MNKKKVPFERVLIGCGFFVGAYIGNTIISPLQTVSPSLINEVLMTFFGGIVGAGALYLIAGALLLMVKLTIHCKNLFQVPSEE